MRAAVDTCRPTRLELLLVQCMRPDPRAPVVERLREKLGPDLARLLVGALARPQRRSARRG